MNKPSFILVVVDRTHDASESIGKAVTLARQSGARIELFLCESEEDYELAHAYDREGIDESRAAIALRARAYLADLKASANAPDIDITFDARCESPCTRGSYEKCCVAVLIWSSRGQLERSTETARWIPTTGSWRVPAR